MMQAPNKLNELLQDMWVDYCDLNPAAKRIYELLTQEGERVENDHIALRTFRHPRLGIDSLSATFKELGYIEKTDYLFPEKKLYAKHYEHPIESLPKIFISELKLEETSSFVRREMEKIIEQIPDSVLKDWKISVSGRSWKALYSTYEALAKESEYASWVYAFGFRPNHFTVNVNLLKKYSSLEKLNQFLESHSYRLNQSGGAIKGSPEVFLEQSSTMASEIPVPFEDGIHSVPGCYYEFAKRYSLPNGKLYQGFVATSADKIFESTDRQK